MVCPFQIQCGDSLINRCWECTAGHAAYVCQLEDNLEALETAKEELKELKDDVIQKLNVEEGQRMKPLKQVQGWVSRAEAKIAEVDELIKQCPEQLLNCKSRYVFGRTVARKLKDVIVLKRKGDFKVVAERTTGESVVERPTEPTVGLDSMLDKLWKCLVEEEVGIVGIYGMGGVGKTTLLIQVNNKFVTSPHDFDLVIWVVVSKDLRPKIVQEEIANRIGLSEDQQWKNKGFTERAEDIFRILHKRKFVLLLDDIWKRVELKDMGVPLPKKQNGSKIVFTTRSEQLCNSMEAEKRIKVEPLAQHEAWELFQSKVGRDTFQANPLIPALAEGVAQKCGGLPLTLITIARAMACRRSLQEWKYALDTLRKSASDLQGMVENVFRILKFSYDCLPDDTVKSCFLYCALFPEDAKILKNNLIDYWICEDFWDDNDNQVDALNKGYTIIGTLVHACLLKEEKEGRFVKMHDTIRDMALWIACKVEKDRENYLVMAGERLTKAPHAGKWEKAKRISLMENRIEQVTEVPNCPRVLTVILRGNRDLKMITNGFFEFMTALTILDLSHTALQVLPPGISKLVTLQYLNLLGTKLKELPSEITNLKKLKYLNLSWNQHLNKIPRDMISSFPLLQVLRMYRCGITCYTEERGVASGDSHHVNVEELERLVHLKELNITIRHASVLHQFLSIPSLIRCTQALSLEGFWDSELFSFSSLKMQNKDWKQILDHGDMAGRKTKSLSGLGKLSTLRNSYFDSLHTVTISKCYHLQDLTWLILAPNLANLVVSNCEKLEQVISFRKLGEVGDGDEKVNPFSRLELLTLQYLPQLKSIYWEALPFPVLEEIVVVKCPLLKKLPLNSSSGKGHQVAIKAEKHWWNSVEWEDTDTRLAFQSSFFDILQQSHIFV